MMRSTTRSWALVVFIGTVLTLVASDVLMRAQTPPTAPTPGAQTGAPPLGPGLGGAAAPGAGRGGGPGAVAAALFQE
jgi:hypothetical protein